MFVNDSIVIYTNGKIIKSEEPSLPYYLPIAGGRIIGFNGKQWENNKINEKW